MSCKLLCILFLLTCSLVSAEEKTVTPPPLPLQNVPPQYQADQAQKIPVGEKLEISNLKPMQVTGFITSSGSIFEVDDKRSVGVIEGRQNGQLLSPQPGEFICNYGSVVVYSDRPCKDVMSMDNQKKNKTRSTTTTNKSVQTETDKQTAQKQTTVVSEQIQADDSSTDIAVAMGSKDEQLNDDERQQQQKPIKKKNRSKASKKKVKKTKKSKNKNKKRPQIGPQRIRVKTKIVKRPTQKQQVQPLRRPQNNRHSRPRPQPQQLQNQRRLQNRINAQYQAQGGFYTTSGGRIYQLVEVSH